MGVCQIQITNQLVRHRKLNSNTVVALWVIQSFLILRPLKGNKRSTGSCKKNETVVLTSISEYKCVSILDVLLYLNVNDKQSTLFTLGGPMTTIEHNHER